MPVFERKKMCQECPFAKNAIKGWLGPWKIEDFENFVKYDSTVICHMDITRLQAEAEDCDEDEDTISEEEIEENGQHCVGMLRYMSAMCKLSRDPEKAKAQNDVKKVKDREVLMPYQFREHHTIGKNNGTQSS